MLCHVGMGLVGLSTAAVLLGGLALLVFLVVRSARGTAALVSNGAGRSSAKENLQAQYARGEIDREQYERRKEEFGKGQGPESS